MIRVKDIEKSLKFYQDVLGMSLFRTNEQPAAKFNLYFLGYPGDKGAPEDGFTADYEGLLELTWNYGTEKDPDFKYHDGNSEPQGFGHICESCPSIPTYLHLATLFIFPSSFFLRKWAKRGRRMRCKKLEHRES